MKLRDELQCDNCTYFKTYSSIKDKETYLEEWVAANDPDTDEEPSKKDKYFFKKGEGIVGVVLENEKSMIVPHAIESEDFIPSFKFLGNNLSMLAVPVMPYKNENGHESIPFWQLCFAFLMTQSNSHSLLRYVFSKVGYFSKYDQPNRIIGVINCYKIEKDFFTVYDRDLVEAIAQITATVIERTMALEYSNNISREMNDLVIDTDKENLLEEKDGLRKKEQLLLRKICEHALKITGARVAIIRRLRLIDSSENAEYRPSDNEYYAYPEDPLAKSPRLNREEGTTKRVINRLKEGNSSETFEFSKKCGNFHLILKSLREHGIKYQIVVPLTIKNDKNNDSKKELIGALYLNKYSDVPLTEVEKHALKLFAKQAASTIYHQEFLSEIITWKQAHANLADATASIAIREDLNLLLKEIAEYSYKLVGEGASFSCLSLVNENDGFEHKATYPEYALAKLSTSYDQVEPSIDETKVRGIIGLAAKDGRTILIDNIISEKEKNSEYGQKYIEIRDSTRSELVVPIRISDKEKTIGVINIEHDKPYAFNKIHKEVIEHFARQVAIAFQKKNLINSVNSKKNMLIVLQRALQKIIESPPQNMLYNAVSLTREAVEAKKVIVVPIQQESWNLTVLNKEVVPDINPRYQDFIQSMNKLSLEVYKKQKIEYCSDLKNAFSRRNIFSINTEHEKESFISSGLCVPFSSRDKKIGVMWMLFSKSLGDELSLEDKAIYQSYADQIALAYDSANQSEKLKRKLANSASELTANIDQNYKNARNQSNISFVICMCTSIAGLALIFFGVSNFLGNEDVKSQVSTSKGGIATVIGVLLQGVTVLAFDRGKAANERMDRYHKELYDVRKLEILLSATEQLNPETASQVKQQIIQSTTDSWIYPNKEIKNLEQPK